MNTTRDQNIRKASWISVIGNAVLAILKIIIGFISGSLAVIGDGLDSSMDVLISLITLFTATYLCKPPDVKHAFGYEKADLIASKVLSLFIFFAGGELIFSSFRRFFGEQELIIPSNAAIYVIILSVLGKIFLSFYLAHSGKKNESSMLRANAKNMKYDIFTSVTVLIGLFFTRFMNLPIADPIAALLVGVWILRGAYKLFMETNTELMDGVEDPNIYNKIFEAVEETPHVQNPHRVRSRTISGYYMIVFDIEVAGNTPLHKAHDLAQQVEEKIREKIPNIFDIVIHTEPIGNYEKEENKGINKQDLSDI